jgi:ABC-type antimicrobial peptide transport system permease subunit
MGGQSPERIREAIRVVTGDVPVDRVAPVKDFLARSIARERFMSGIGAVLGLTAAIAAGLGLYGAFTYLSVIRRRQSAIRVAVGATPSHIVFMMARMAFIVVTIGSVAGVLAAALMASTVSAVFFEVRFADPLLVATVLLGVALLAAVALIGPTKRLLSIDLPELLRHQ